MLRLPVRDASGGYRADRAAALNDLAPRSVRSQGYCLQIDLTLLAMRAGQKAVEVPTTVTERAHGSSKMSRAIVAEALRKVTERGGGGRLGRSPDR